MTSIGLENMMTTTIGIDVSKDRLDAHRLPRPFIRRQLPTGDGLHDVIDGRQRAAGVPQLG